MRNGALRPPFPPRAAGVGGAEPQCSAKTLLKWPPPKQRQQRHKGWEDRRQLGADGEGMGWMGDVG